MDSPYSFWARNADPKKLAVIFPGGGACWNASSCDQNNEYSNFEAEAGLDQNPSGEGGIFDFSNTDNPLQERSFIVVPTCNGDVFLGDNTVTYKIEETDGAKKTYEIQHKGYANAMSAIEWAQNAFPNADDITVMGWSAGAIPSPLYTHILAQKYPDAQVSHLADGAGGYHVDDELDEAFQNWGTANVFRQVQGFEDLATQDFSFSDIYIRAAELNPNINFHQLNIANDTTQSFFLGALGIENPDVHQRILTAQAYINERVPNFRTYTIGGDGENIIGGYYDGFLNHSLQNNGYPYALDRLYSYTSNDVPVIDWINAVLANNDVNNVSCQNCDAPEYTVVFEEEN
ncbi:MAG: pectin acetylesterase-family hydrolase [Cognatishimia sp.]